MNSVAGSFPLTLDGVEADVTFYELVFAQLADLEHEVQLPILLAEDSCVAEYDSACP